MATLSQSRLDSARRLYGMGAIQAAADGLLGLPDEEQDRLLLGACMARLRRFDEAMTAFERLLRDDPEQYEALTWMAVLKKNRREIDEAIGYARRATLLRPDDGTGFGSLGACLLYKRMAPEATDAFRRATELAPDVAEHEHNLALALLMDHRHGEAIPRLRRAIELAPRSPQSYLVLASTYGLYGMAGQAIECLTQGLAQIPDAPALHSALAEAFAMVRNDEAAEAHFHRALDLSPQARGAYATWLLNQGRFPEADALYEAMLRDGSDPALAYYGLMQSRKAPEPEFVGAMETLLDEGGLGAGSEMYLRYALGRASEGLKAFGKAMAHFDAANALAYSIHHAGHPLPEDHFRAENLGVQRTYEAIRDLRGAGHPTASPIFIVGMIRSGTTLLDQIVSSHPAVGAAGELRFWIEEALRLVAMPGTPTAADLERLSEEYLGYARLLAGPAERITDKMPLNFAYAGIIDVAMPNAKFLHIRRNPVDTCLSIWTTYFGKGALFGYDKPNIVAYYREYRRMMAYWREALPKDRLFELDYESLIESPETVVPQIVEFLGLPWDDACLRHDQNPSAINTPSRWQARQPIYRTSVERWRRYEPWLGEFAELLEEA